MLLRNLAKTNKNVVLLDIGANVGSYSICMMDVCSEVIAFEPHPFTNKRCKMNFLLNEYSESNVKQIALSNKSGMVFFSDIGGSSTVNHILDNDAGIQVNVTTLDEFISTIEIAEKSFLVKIDVEGFEEQVIEGGGNFFRNFNILGVIFECFENENVPKKLKTYGFVNIKKG